MAETTPDTVYTLRNVPKTYTNFSGIAFPERGQESQTFLKPFIQMGTLAAPLHVKTTTIPLSEIQATTALTTGTVKGMNINIVTTAAMTGAGHVYGLYVTIDTDYKLGGSNTAIYGKLDLSTTGAAHGMASAITAELIVPNSSLSRGALYALELELGAGATSSWGSAGPVAMIYAGFWGTMTQINANAFFMHVVGLTGAAGAMLGANSNTLKVRIGTTTEYLMLSEYEDTLSIGLTGAKKTLVTGVPEIAVWSTSALTSGTQDVVKIDFTQTAAQQTGYIKGIRCTMTSDVKTPGSFNAIKGIVDFSTNGYAWGDAAPLASELTMPNSVASHGTYYGMDMQISIGASSNWESAGPCAFIKFGLLGTPLEFEEEGYLFHLTGFGAATAGEIFDVCTADAASHALKILINTTPYYIMLQDNVDA